MDKETDKQLDKFTGKILKDFPRETPSFDFTTKVMDKVDVLSSAQVIEYKPLISKKIWAVVALSVIGVFCYFVFGDVQFENPALLSKALNFMPNFDSLALPDYKVSNVFLYAFIGLAFFISIQTFLLKNHFDKRFVMD